MLASPASHSVDVGRSAYGLGMSRNDLARMLVVVMSAGEIPRLDMADPRAAHSTLVSLVVDPVGRAVCDRLNAQVATTRIQTSVFESVA